MQSFSRIASVLVLLTGVAGFSFASGSQDSTTLYQTSVPDQTTIGSVQVPVTQEIRDWFSKTNFDFDFAWKSPTGNKVPGMAIDGNLIDAPLATLSEKYKETLDAIMTDVNQRPILLAMVEPALKAALVRGSVEQATMRIGRQIFTMTLNGPEDIGY
jgi:hypothetical protein